MATPHDTAGAGGAGHAGTAPPPWRPDVHRLRRSREDRRVAGVCGGAGAWVGVDPLLLRVTAVVLTLFGGAGLVLYGLAWLLVPEEGRLRSEGQRLLRGRGSAGAVVAVVAVIAGTSFALGQLRSGDLQGLVLLGLVGTAAVLALRHGGLVDRYAPEPPPVPAVPPAATRGPAAEAVAAHAAPAPAAAPPRPAPAAAATPPPPEQARVAEAFAPHGPYAMPAAPLYAPPPGTGGPYGAYDPRAPYGRGATALRPERRRERRRRSVLGLLTVSAALLAVGAVGGLTVAAGGTPQPVVLLGTALAVVGLGLVVSAFVGRARGLVPLGVLLSLLLGGAAALDGARVPSGGVGERVWTPSSALALEEVPVYELGLGSALLDLRSLPNIAPGSTVRLGAEVGAGELEVQLPSPAVAAVEVVAHASAGEVYLPGQDPSGGRGVDATWSRPQRPAPAPGRGVTLVLDLHVGLGVVEVHR
ncbi:PspC domain-containing protein [Vallicoccus soli]|uniref:PspC domain-containing protein n=1 Tax=Vallicoccus soli TaxID=2339232 RepID=A0A3A3YQZ1_9ACTN|nr:PspC domain-containing protein [Vallicoccus soli]RJK92642.1 PspC domain-containing protein [Vallicoccus soli]